MSLILCGISFFLGTVLYCGNQLNGIDNDILSCRLEGMSYGGVDLEAPLWEEINILIKNLTIDSVPSVVVSTV